jgi:hypothetical protein
MSNNFNNVNISDLSDPDEDDSPALVKNKGSKYIAYQGKLIIDKNNTPNKSIKAQSAGLLSYPLLQHYEEDIVAENVVRLARKGEYLKTILNNPLAYINEPEGYLYLTQIPGYSDAETQVHLIQKYIQANHYYIAAFKQNHNLDHSRENQGNLESHALSAAQKDKQAAYEIAKCYATLPSKYLDENYDNYHDFIKFIEILYPMTPQQTEQLQQYHRNKLILQENKKKFTTGQQNSHSRRNSEINEEETFDLHSFIGHNPSEIGANVAAHSAENSETEDSEEDSGESHGSHSDRSHNQPELDKITLDQRLSAEEKAHFLREQLNNYLDSVEITLLTQINARSASFFSSLITIQQLHAEISSSIAQIQHIRGQIAIIQQKLVRNGLLLHRNTRKLANYNALIEILGLLAAVIHNFAQISSKIAENQPREAIELIKITQNTVENQLKGVKLAEIYGEKLEKATNLLESSILEQFLALAIDLDNNYRNSSANHNIWLLSEDEKTNFVCYLRCFMQISPLSSLFSPYKLEFVRSFPRKFGEQLQELLPVENCRETSSDNPAKELISGNYLIQLTNNIQDYVISLQHREFLALLEGLFNQLLQPILRQDAIKAVIVEENGPESPEIAGINAQFNDLLRCGVDWAHSKLSHLIKCRQSLHNQLQLTEIAELSALCMVNISTAERLCGCEVTQLRSVVYEQSHGFLLAFHSSCIGELTLALEREQWIRVEVPREYQNCIDNDYSSKITPNTFTKANNGSDNKENNKNSEKLSATAASNSNSAGARVFFVERKSLDRSSISLSPNAAPVANSPSNSSHFEKFPTVRSVLILVALTSHYIDCLALLPASSADILAKLCEMWQIFNSRATQLVLGAGALHLAGLKTITTSHLALASQCVAFGITQLLRLKEILKGKLGTAQQSQAAAQFDRLIADYSNHQREIYEKLISIMNELCEQSIKKFLLSTTAWSSSNSKIASGVNSDEFIDTNFKLLISQSKSLNQSLSQLLSPAQREKIFNSLCSQYCLTLAKQLILKLDCSKNYVKQRLHLQIIYIVKNLAVLPGFNRAAVQQLCRELQLNDTAFLEKLIAERNLNNSNELARGESAPNNGEKNNNDRQVNAAITGENNPAEISENHLPEPEQINSYVGEVSE